MPENIVPTSGYSFFSSEVGAATRALLRGENLAPAMVHGLLNGGAAAALRAHVSKRTRSEFGMFFSGEKLAGRVAQMAKPFVTPESVIADPTCGAGDLLLPFFADAALSGTVDATLKRWAKRIIALELHPHLSIATKERLALLAASRLSQSGTFLRANGAYNVDLLSRIEVGDYLNRLKLTAEADIVLMNPPFTEANAPEGCKWSSGKVQQAAVFVLHALEQAKCEQRIFAILPDVLRSGTRYERWRQTVASLAEIEALEVYGRFDPHTDVDVFIVHMKRRDRTLLRSWPAVEPSGEGRQIADLFKVSVGSVVPHRHKQRGSWVLYLDVSGAPADMEIVPSKQRRFGGTLHEGPFVVLRRTSSPSDARRLVPTLVNTRESVAVENHLLVLQPRNKTLKACRELVNVLPLVDAELNKSMRCRHLTTKAVAELRLTSSND